MAKITTRQPDQSSDSAIYDRLKEIIEEATQGAVGGGSTAIVKLAPDVPGALNDLQNVFRALNAAALQLVQDLAYEAHENLVLSVKMAEALDIIDSFCNVSYDEDLDHATMDMMDAMISAGIADCTADGDLTFDPRIIVAKSDLKPVLREALNRWVELKVSK